MHGLTNEQRRLLLILSRHSRGTTLFGENDKRIVRELTFSGYLSDIYDMPSGGLSARITEAGRTALTDQERLADRVSGEREALKRGKGPLGVIRGRAQAQQGGGNV